MKQNLGFAEFTLASSMKHNRSLKNMEALNRYIDWEWINTILLNNYTVGTAGEGADAYPPLLLYKCLLLQKWFHIDSDVKLENQINDRLSFKKFLGLSFSKPSPDHSTFSRFREGGRDFFASPKCNRQTAALIQWIASFAAGARHVLRRAMWRAHSRT